MEPQELAHQFAFLHRTSWSLFQTIRLTPALLWSERSNIRGEYLGFVCMHVLSRFSKHQSQRCPSLWLRFPEHRPKFTAPWVRSREAAAHCSAGFLHQHQQRRRIHPRNQWTVCEYKHQGNEKEAQQLRNCCCCLGPLFHSRIIRSCSCVSSYWCCLVHSSHASKLSAFVGLPEAVVLVIGHCPPTSEWTLQFWWHYTCTLRFPIDPLAFETAVSIEKK